MKKYLKFILPPVIGAIAGYAYYYYVGCVSGSCPITSNPISSTLYGMLAGAVFLIPSKKKNEGTKD